MGDGEECVMRWIIVWSIDCRHGTSSQMSLVFTYLHLPSEQSIERLLYDFHYD